MQNQPKIMLITGEASGDLHGASLAKEIKQLIPDAQISGMGGQRMAEAGVSLLADISDLSVCGVVEVIRYLPRIISRFNFIKKAIAQQKPDLLILIDYPTFNLKLAKAAKKLGVQILYYISPQVWAWHTSRVKKIKKWVAMMAVIFPFEKEFYQKYDVPVKYVGHPLVKNIDPPTIKQAAHQYFEVNPDKITIGLLPGSRQNEIHYLLPILIETAKLLYHKIPNVQFILPLASTITLEDIRPFIEGVQLPLKITQEHAYEAMSLCQAVVAASGTVTLELALLGLPMVVVYKVNKITYAIGKRVVKIPFLCLCNTIAGKRIVSELLQNDAQPELIAAELQRLLEDKDYRATQIAELAIVADKLNTKKECTTAELVYQLVNPS